MVWLPDGQKLCDDMFSRFDRIVACDRQTDRRTDILHSIAQLKPTFTLYVKCCSASCLQQMFTFRHALSPLINGLVDDAPMKL